MVQLFVPQTSGVMPIQQPDSFIRNAARQEQRRKTMKMMGGNMHFRAVMTM
jgi:hypothetical protein